MHKPPREIAAAILVGTCGRLLLQQRDDVPGIFYPGQVGLFGGHRESCESPLDCARRELAEETGLVLDPGRLQPLVDMQAAYAAGGGVRATFFVVRGVPIDGLVITEGSALIVEPAALPLLLARMTPTACFAARVFLETGG